MPSQLLAGSLGRARHAAGERFSQQQRRFERTRSDSALRMNELWAVTRADPNMSCTEYAIKDLMTPLDEGDSYARRQNE
jgi:hypothetical protein